MKGGGLGPYDPGEWSDDTQMTLCVAAGRRAGWRPHLARRARPASRRPSSSWLAGGATDVGAQTRAVLIEAERLPGAAARAAVAASEDLHARTGRTAGNGALMRTSIVGISRVHDREATARAARAVAELTHADPLAADSSVLWSEAIRLAVTEGRLDLARRARPRHHRRTPAAGATGSRRRRAPPTRGSSPTTATPSPRCRPRGRPSPRPTAATAPRCTSSAACRRPCGRGTTPTPWPPSRARCSGRATAPRRCPPSGAGWCTAGPGCAPTTSSSSPCRPMSGGRASRHVAIGRRPWPTRRSHHWACRTRSTPTSCSAPSRDLFRVEELDVQAVVSLCPLGLQDIPAQGITPRDHIEFWINDDDARGVKPPPRLRARRRVVGAAPVPRRGQARARALP